MAAPHRPKPLLRPLCINLDTTIPFLRAVSYAVVAQRTTSLQWREEQGAIKYLYGAFLGAFGTPGTVEVKTATEAQIKKEVDIATLHRIDVLMAKAQAGPAAVAEYLIRTQGLSILSKHRVRFGATHRLWGSS